MDLLTPPVGGLRPPTKSKAALRAPVFQGPSGAGKATLLGFIGFMVRRSSGRVRMKRRDTSGIPERFLSQIRRQSFVFRNFHLTPRASVLENVLLPTYPSNQSPRHAHHRAGSLLEALMRTGTERSDFNHTIICSYEFFSRSSC